MRSSDVVQKTACATSTRRIIDSAFPGDTIAAMRAYWLALAWAAVACGVYAAQILLRVGDLG